MAPLHRTIALVQMEQVAMLVRRDLHYYVPRPWQILLKENGSVTESRFGLTLRFLKPRRELLEIVHHAHPATASAHGGLHNHRIANFRRDRSSFRRRCYGPFGTRKHRNPGGLGEPTRGCLVAEEREQLGSRPDKRQPGLCTR